MCFFCILTGSIYSFIRNFILVNCILISYGFLYLLICLLCLFFELRNRCWFFDNIILASMNKINILSCFIGIICFFSSNAQELEVDDSVNEDQLINAIINSNCESITNLNVVGSPNDNSYGTFTASGNNNFDLNSGVVLTTGLAANAGNTEGNNEEGSGWVGSALYESTLGLDNGRTLNATELEFNFIALQNDLVLEYVFASEEFEGANACSSKEGVVILIKREGEPDSSFENIALIEGTNLPVTIENIHEAQTSPVVCSAANEEVLIGTRTTVDLFPNYARYTETLQAETNSIIGESYTVRIIVADQPNTVQGNDAIRDSAVFVSLFENNVDLDFTAINTTDNNVVSITNNTIGECTESIRLSLTDNENYNYEWFNNNELIIGETDSSLTITESGNYQYSITLDSLNETCVFSDSVNVTLIQNREGNILSNLSICTQGGGIPTYDLTTRNIDALENIDATAVVYLDGNENVITDPTAYEGNNNETITARVVDAGGCIFTSTFLLEESTEGNAFDQAVYEYIICDGGVNFVVNDGTEAVFFSVVNELVFPFLLDSSGNINGSIEYFRESETISIQAVGVIVNFNERLLVQYTSNEGCVSNAFLDIVVNQAPRSSLIQGNSINIGEIEVCDIGVDQNDRDGFTVFDLTEIEQELINSIDSNGFDTIEFFPTENDAENETNRIIDISAYRNVDEILQIAWVRLTSETGCASIANLELRARYLVSNSNFSDERVCDFNDNGIGTFDLSNKASSIVGDNDYTAEIYPTYADLLARTNEITGSYENTIPFQDERLFVVLEDNETGCQDYAREDPNNLGNPLEPEIASFLLIVEPIPVIQTPTIVLDAICDIDSDGVINGFVSYFNEFNDGEFRRQISNSEGVDVFYFAEPIDQGTFNSNDVFDAIDDNFNNIATPDSVIKFYAIGGSNFSGTPCFSNVISFDVVVNPAPAIDNVPDTIFECYLAADNPTSFEFQLDQNESQINSDSNVLITYYQTLEAAELGEGIDNPDFIENATYIYDTSSFVGDNTDSGSEFSVFFRLENNLTGCVSFGEQEIVINTQPVVDEVIDFILCVDPGESQAGFLLSSKDAEVLGNQTGKVVSYYMTQAAAEAGLPNSAIPSDIPFDSAGGQTIFVRVENDDDSNCNTTDIISQFTLQVEEFSVVGDASSITFEACDENPSGNEYSAFFDLQEAINIISDNGTIDVNVVFYESIEDAGGDILATNTVQLDAPGEPLVDEEPENTNNFIYESQIFTNSIIARINDNTSGCVQFQEIDLTINPLPSVDEIEDLAVCDTLGDGVEMIDLTAIEAAVLFNDTEAQIIVDTILQNTNQSIVEYNYFRTEAESNDFVSGTITQSNILDYTQFEVSEETTEVFVVISLTGCVFQSSFNINLDELPQVVSRSVSVCGSSLGAEGFVIDLTTLNDDFEFYTGNDSNVELVYYENSDASNEIITDTFTKPDNLNSIFLEAVNTATGCVSEIIEIPLTAIDLPNVTVPSIDDITICDLDGGADGITMYNLSVLNSVILANEAVETDFNVEYFLTSDINFETELTDGNTIVENGESYTAIVSSANNEFGCNNLLSFNITINNSPEIETLNPLQVCDDNDIFTDDLFPVDLTEIENEFVYVSNEFTVNTITYYNDSSRLLINEIANPASYLKTGNEDEIIYLDLESDLGCVFETEFTLQINNLPTIDVGLVFDQFCEDSLGSGISTIENLNTEFTQNIFENSSSLSVNYFIDNSLTNEITEPFEASSGIIYFQVIDDVTSCENQGSFEIIVNPLPEINTVSSSILSICDEDGDNDGNILFEFDALSNEFLGNQSLLNFTVSYHETEQDAFDGNNITEDEVSLVGQYFVKITNNITGCYNVDSFEVNVNLLPEIVQDEIFFCPNDPSRIFDLNTGNIDDVYLWEFSSGRINESTSAISLGLDDVDTTVSLTITNSVTNCENSIVFNVLNSPTPTIEPIVERLFDSDEVVINVNETGDFLYALTKSTNIPDISDPEIQESNVFTDVLPGRFYAHVIDLNGCGEVAPVEVVFVDYFPFFTPNGEGPVETETWHIQGIVGSSIENAVVYIYNRFGVLMTALTANSPGWDGTYQGTPMPTDDYWILIDLGNGEQVKDHITLKR